MQLSLNVLLVMDCVLRLASPTHENDPCPSGNFSFSFSFVSALLAYINILKDQKKLPEMKD